jgi:hypothetical protein
MTTRADFSGGTVDQLLLDAGHSDVPELRAALLSIASLAQMQAPAPGPELAAMLAGPRDELTRQRWLRRHRPAVVGLAVLVGMGLGVSGVAATSQVSGVGSGSVSLQELTTDWTPEWTLPLAPAVADQGGRITWVSPLFLQLDRADPAAAHGLGEPSAQTAEPAAQTAGPEGGAVGPAAPATSAHDKGKSPIGKGWAAAGTSMGNPGPANPGKARLGKAATDQAMTGRAPDQPEEQEAEVTPDAGEAAAGAPASGVKQAAKSSVKLGSTVESAIDSTVDSALGSASSWLGKFRR